MKYKYRIFLSLIFLIVLATPHAYAQEEVFPQAQGYVNDFASIINAQDEQIIKSLVMGLEQKTSAEIVIVTLKSTKPYDVQDYSVRLWDKWKIGKAGKDNGVLLLVAVNDRKAWITTGYGLEGAIPDAQASTIYRSIMVPYFKKGEYSKGTLAATIALVELAAKEYNVSIDELPALSKEYVESVKPTPLASFLNGLFSLIIFVVFFGFRMGLFGYLLLGSGRRRGGYWYGGGVSGTSGGFSGGFGGFGGGFTGGGGAGGGW